MKKMMLAAMVGLGLLGMRAEVQAASGAALSARAYVQDGLVGMLDGIENAGWGVHNASATSWKDLAGTIGDFAVDSCAQFQADGLKKISAGVMAGVGSGASKPNNLKTIEAAVSGANSVLPNATDYIIPVYVDRNQYIAFNWNGSTRQMSFDSIGGGNGWRTSETPDAVTYSVAYTPFSKANGFYVNAAHPDGYAFSDSYGDDLGTTAIHLGARELSSSRIDTKAYNFTVNALRFYTRELTEDEVKQNYLIDAYRFRGEIPFATADYKADETGKQLLCRFTAKGAKGIKVTVNGEKAGEKWFKAGEVVTLTATPFAGAIFKGWKGTVEGYDAEDLKSLSIAVTVDRALDLIADGECNSDILQSDDVSPLSAKAYVQDGLVGFLDGFENAGWNKHSAAATSWKDLAGTIGDFAVDASCAQFLANGLKKIDAGVMAGVGSGSSKPNNI